MLRTGPGGVVEEDAAGHGRSWCYAGAERRSGRHREATMSDADEIRALTEELERLGSQAGDEQDEAATAANKARQTEIRARLAALGRPVG